MDHHFHDGTRRLRILGGIIQNKNMRKDQGSTNQDPKTENLRALSKLYFNGQKSKKNFVRWLNHFPCSTDHQHSFCNAEPNVPAAEMLHEVQYNNQNHYPIFEFYNVSPHLGLLPIENNLLDGIQILFW